MNRPYPPRAWPGNQTVGAKALVLVELLLKHDWAAFAVVIAGTAALVEVLK